MSGAVRIFRPAKTAMQSGLRNTKRWLLEFEPTDSIATDSLMGWSGSHDTDRQLRVWFEARDEAIAFADKKGLTYRVIDPQAKAIRPKAYADNFSFKKVS
jgi:hypothetical protein